MLPIPKALPIKIYIGRAPIPAHRKLARCTQAVDSDAEDQKNHAGPGLDEIASTTEGRLRPGCGCASPKREDSHEPQPRDQTTCVASTITVPTPPGQMGCDNGEMQENHEEREPGQARVWKRT